MSTKHEQVEPLPVEPIKWYACKCGHFDQVNDESGLCSRCKKEAQDERRTKS